MSGESPDTKNTKEVKTYFETKLQRNLTDKELSECIQSLYYLGRAIYKFNLQKQEVKNG
jgi:hypothetical protein